MFPLLEELDMGLVAFSPLANGLLTKCYTAETRFDVRMDYRVVMPQFQMKSFEQNESLFSLIDRLAEKYHAIPSQIALSWTMNKRPWIIPILGTCHLCRLKENAGAADVHRRVCRFDRRRHEMLAHPAAVQGRKEGNDVADSSASGARA